MNIFPEIEVQIIKNPENRCPNKRGLTVSCRFILKAIGFPTLEPLASMLTIVTGQKWKDIRSILSPAFTSGKLKGMMYIMEKAGDVLLQKIGSAIERNETVDIHKLVTKYKTC